MLDSYATLAIRLTGLFGWREWQLFFRTFVIAIPIRRVVSLFFVSSGTALFLFLLLVILILILIGNIVGHRGTERDNAGQTSVVHSRWPSGPHQACFRSGSPTVLAAPKRPADAFWCTLTTVDPSDRPKASQGAPIDELTVLDETIGRLRSRIATGDAFVPRTIGTFGRTPW